MTRVDFYHLQNQNLESILPKLLEKAYETGKKIKVKVGVDKEVENINTFLWTYSDVSFLPHGTAKDGSSSMQPIFLSTEDDNPNGAEFLFLVEGADIDISTISGFERVFNIFDGNQNETLNKSRELWKAVKDENLEANYWQYVSNNWVKKA